MEDFTVTSTLTKKEYKRYTLMSFYRTPVIIGITILGILITTIVLLQLIEVIHIYDDIPWLGFLFGIALVLLPLNTINNMVNRIFPNSYMTKVVDYQFGLAGINIKDAMSKVFLKWGSIIRCDETKDFLVFNQTSKIAFLVKKDLLSMKQIEFIRSKVLKT